VAWNFSPHPRVQTGSAVHPASYPMGTKGSFPGVKLPGREADHSTPSSTEVKSAWNYASTPPIRFHMVFDYRKQSVFGSLLNSHRISQLK
jgi:hypothetical protein